MTQLQLLEKLEELKKYIWLETGNANMLYGKREFIDDKFKEIIDELDDIDLEDTTDIMDMGLNELSISED
jgi:hypothetical protein